MMSLENPETLFSLELLVDYIRLEKLCKVPDGIALGVRLLDFPTLLIHQHRSKTVGSNQPVRKQPDGQREFAFNRGKCCFFKMNLDSLHVHLSATPLYAMVLDVSEESSPRLVGSSLISLAEAMDRIKLISSPSAHTGKGVVAVCNLSGEKIGAISLSYKLVCLGASLLPHITEGRGYKCTSTPGGEDQEHFKEKMKSVSMCSPTGNKSEFSIHSNDAGDSKIRLDEHEEDDCAEGQTNTIEADLAAFCPPHLYYRNTAQAKIGNGNQDYRLLNLCPEAFTFEDSICEDEEHKKKVEGSVSRAVHQKMSRATKTPTQETSDNTNILREALQQLPLLNALVAELSQLTVYPSPDRINRPVTDDHRKSPRTQSLYKTASLSDINLNHLPPPRNCSTPIVYPVKREDNQKEPLKSRKTQRKKLTYGTTKTFNLRLKQISPLKVNNRECTELIKSGTQSRTAKEKEKSNSKAIKSKKRGLLYRGSNLDENIETVVQSLTVDSAVGETVTLKAKSQQGAQDGRTQGDSEDFHSLKELKCIPSPNPSVHSDSAHLSKDKNTHHTELDQSDSQSDWDKNRVSIPDLIERQSSRSNSPESLFSECSNNENDANYADDFDSLESSNESSIANTPKSPVSSDSCISNPRFEGYQKNPDRHPVPVKALKSPHQVLMGTHIIQPRTRSSALSCSSNDDSCDVEKPSCSRNQAKTNGKMEHGFCAESVLVSRSEKKNSPGNRSHVGGFSAQSTSSFEAQTVEELEDEVGSLDFRKEYQHISELVASKLPGYTM
ncbi:microtubule-associated protein 10 [Poeciliopsis prolifica]|uniref:microtubule-associated protein 10 n=1 Tax=Poeciliopsis prolifica TaxID=188132 RepID=UPI002413A10D|nr:microtubule-associated protein 10 [Poeciliopsis prolifica]